jgi:hypothetical protein
MKKLTLKDMLQLSGLEQSTRERDPAKPWLFIEPEERKRLVKDLNAEAKDEAIEEHKAKARAFGHYLTCTKCGESDLRRVYHDLTMEDGKGRSVNAEHLHVICGDCRADIGIELPKDWGGWRVAS